MGAVKHLFRATRDVMGGAFGGLVAAWVLTDIDHRVVTILAVAAVFGVALIYSVFDWAETQEEATRSETDQSPSLRWPPHRAS